LRKPYIKIKQKDCINKIIILLKEVIALSYFELKEHVKKLEAKLSSLEAKFTYLLFRINENVPELEETTDCLLDCGSVVKPEKSKIKRAKQNKK